MRYLRRLPFGSIKSGCGSGVLPDSRPSEFKTDQPARAGSCSASASE
jgi:hypothetical protein